MEISKRNMLDAISDVLKGRSIGSSWVSSYDIKKSLRKRFSVSFSYYELRKTGMKLCKDNTLEKKRVGGLLSYRII